MTKQIMNTFGFKYRYRMSIRDPKQPEKYLGDPKEWDRIEKWMVEIMERNGIEYFEGVGEASFYAPKMDLMATDALGREWQLSTVQIDYVQPVRFDLEYTNEQGTKSRPVTIHRAIVGSPERLMMILIEHYAGAFPVWLAPIEVSIIPIGEKHVEYANKVAANMKSAGIRLVVNDKNETMQAKIRDAQNLKIPYMLIMGDKEIADNKVSVRLRTGENKGALTVTEIADKIKEIELTKGVNLW
jgi:threonyl-tRNA synthetase